MENKRPVSITVIAIFLLISAAFSVYSTLTIDSNPIARDMLQNVNAPMWLYKANGIIGALITVVCALGFLKGLPWSRVLYIGWSILGMVISLMILPAISLVVMSLIFLAIVGFFLFRPKADEWFGTRGLGLTRNRA